ncbi:hypothetical protein [Variovorax sp. E3]|uniref:hypothetical protein n=1 Tax=Variovorax sp. E3 TaxID=1914993 RepID=UPI0018DC6B97|nr:hypothetical protein [Variovorax sp. E3]
MARRIMARPRTPVPLGATAAPTATDLLENRLEQLRSLLWSFHGDGNRWGDHPETQHLNNVFWALAELAEDAAALFQESAQAHPQQVPRKA